jgi:hypothetical protein
MLQAIASNSPESCNALARLTLAQFAMPKCHTCINTYLEVGLPVFTVCCRQLYELGIE